jgi:microcompartment protein CcmL/EutN
MPTARFAGLDALGLLELGSIARGYRTLDTMVKHSPVVTIEANLVEPGKFLIWFGGGVAEVELADAAGVATAGELLLDRVLLPRAHPVLWRRLAGRTARGAVDCLGIVEGSGIARTIEAADRSAKDADVRLRALRVSPALGGRAYYVVDGPQHAVEAAVAAGVAVLEGASKLLDAQVIPNAAPEFLAMVLRPAPFGR